MTDKKPINNDGMTVATGGLRSGHQYKSTTSKVVPVKRVVAQPVVEAPALPIVVSKPAKPATAAKE